MNTLPVEISVRIMQLVSHPLADVTTHEIKTKYTYLQGFVDFGYSFSSAYFQIYSEIKQIEEERILGTSA